MTRADLVATLDQRPVAIGLAAVTILLPILFVVVTASPLDQPFAKDVLLYIDAADRWLAGGPFYEPRQLAGPYEVAHGDILYPPVGLWLFAPAAILPLPIGLVLWWSIPAAITAWAILRVSPRPAVWPLIALCLAWPTTLLKIWTGNPVIWWHRGDGGRHRLARGAPSRCRFRLFLFAPSASGSGRGGSASRSSSDCVSRSGRWATG